MRRVFGLGTAGCIPTPAVCAPPTSFPRHQNQRHVDVESESGGGLQLKLGKRSKKKKAERTGGRKKDDDEASTYEGTVWPLFFFFFILM